MKLQLTQTSTNMLGIKRKEDHLAIKCELMLLSPRHIYYTQVFSLSGDSVVLYNSEDEFA